MAKKASEADPKLEQDPTSEAERKRKEQEKGSEGGGGPVQEPKTLEELKAQLLGDETFLKSVAQTEFVQKVIQSERDGQVHQLTLPMKQKIEDLEARLAASEKVNDPMAERYRQLKEAGHYEEALQVLEERQRLADSEATAVARGRREGAQETLQGIAARSEFSSLTQDDWHQVYADAAAEASQKGRNYITVDEYTGHATHRVVEKEKAAMTQQTKEERDQEISEQVDAALKDAGIERRTKEGGPEGDGGTPVGAGGLPTDEEVAAMNQEDYNKLSDETRTALLQRAADKMK